MNVVAAQKKIKLFVSKAHNTVNHFKMFFQRSAENY